MIQLGKSLIKQAFKVGGLIPSGKISSVWTRHSRVDLLHYSPLKYVMMSFQALCGGRVVMVHMGVTIHLRQCRCSTFNKHSTIETWRQFLLFEALKDRFIILKSVCPNKHWNVFYLLSSFFMFILTIWTTVLLLCKHVFKSFT